MFVKFMMSGAHSRHGADVVVNNLLLCITYAVQGFEFYQCHMRRTPQCTTANLMSLYRGCGGLEL